LENTNNIIIAIDGHSSTGKSTVAKTLAKSLNYIYVDTGAMYRAVTWYALQNGIINNSINVNLLIDKLEAISISFKNIKGCNHTFVNGVDVENEIRGLEVANWVSKVASISEVRKKLVSEQQAIGGNKGIVMDGRDIGTVVFPNASLKIFMTASAEIRAKRRFEELLQKEETVTYETVLANVIQRDFLDENREDSPLRKANDAVVIDNSKLTKEAQFEYVLQLAKEKINKT